MIGISIGSHTRLDAVARQIRAVRRASRNRAIGVMVGGPLLIDHPEIASVVGADTTAADGAQAVAQAEGTARIAAAEPIITSDAIHPAHGTWGLGEVRYGGMQSV